MRGISSRRAAWAASLALSILAGACAGDGGSIAAPSSTSTTMTGGSGATLAQIQSTIFTPTCGVAGCHDSFTAAGSLDLSTTDDSFNELVGVVSECGTAVRVVPGDAGASYLLDKLGAGAAPCGDVMPLVFPRLSDGELQLIRDWIEDGAAPGLYATIPVSSTSTTLSPRGDAMRVRRDRGRG